MMETNKKIQDVTNSPEDWEDFWNSPEEQDYYNSESEGKDIPSKSVNKSVDRYVDYVTGVVPHPPAFKRDSKLSE